MEAKLHLQIDSEILLKAQEYARKRGTSISSLVEAYLKSLSIMPDQNDWHISPFVKGMGGSALFPEGLDERAMYSKYIDEKYT